MAATGVATRAASLQALNAILTAPIGRLLFPRTLDCRSRAAPSD